MTAPLEDPAREAWSIIAGLFFSDVVHTRFHDACQAIGVTPPALKALLSMEPDEAQPMRALATQWRCDASWVTSLVDTLEEQGLVERRVLPTDRRVKTVVLTRTGEEAKQKALDALNQPPQLIADLSRKDQIQLRDALQKLES